MINLMRPEKPVRHYVNKIAENDEEYITILLDAILSDACHLLTSYGNADYALDMRTIKNRIQTEGISFATITLPRFFNCVLNAVESGVLSFEGFKINPTSRLPVFLGELVRRVVCDKEDCTIALKVLYALCVSFKKLKGPYKSSVLSNELDKFIDVDESLSAVNFNSKEIRSVSRRARQIITTLFKGIDPGRFRPKPGSGATNTPLKYHKRFEPHVVYEQLSDTFPYPQWFYTNAWGFKSEVQNYFALARAEYPTSRLKFIHKYVGKPRGICIEENETQYMQQGVKTELYDYIENHPMTKGRVNFGSQEINRDLALKSSSDKDLSTIDMSEASNRIARDGVFYLFRDTPLLPFLDACSTRYIVYPKDVREGSKLSHMFAPMGSAVCFPIMAIVHFALIKAIIQLSKKRNARKLSKRVYVYGDDILAPVEFTEDIFTILPKFGMKLNKEKSFFKSSFRESCGIHAYKGVDITPVYNNYTLNVTHESRDSTRLLSTLAKESLYHERGFRNTSGVIRRHIQHVYGQLPEGKSTSSILCFKRDRAFLSVGQKALAEKKQYDDGLQSFRYKMRTVVPRFKEPVALKSTGALLRWHLTTARESNRFMEYDSQKIVNRWVYESDLG